MRADQMAATIPEAWDALRLGICVSAIVDQVRLALAQWPGIPAFSAALTQAVTLKAYLAGGTMREAYRSGGGYSRDFDFLISRDGSVDFLRELARSGTVSRGPFGSPRWVPYEGGDRYADIIILEEFDNGLWPCIDITDALNQFDFTANAIAFDLRSGDIHDPQNGIRDAVDGVLRAVRFDFPDEPISAETSLTRHGVMWIRFAHYAAALDLRVEEITESWMIENRGHIRQLDEFSRVFFPPARDYIDRLHAG